jgi:hypothetical protein
LKRIEDLSLQITALLDAQSCSQHQQDNEQNQFSGH